MNKSLMVVAAKYRLTEALSYQNGTWKKDGAKELIFERKIIERAYAERENSQATSNVLWVIDEEATAQMEIERQKNIQLNAERDQREKLSTADLVEAITRVAKPESKAKKKSDDAPTVEKSETPDESWTADELRAYLDENDISYSPRHGKAKLIELATK